MNSDFDWLDEPELSEQQAVAQLKDPAINHFLARVNETGERQPKSLSRSSGSKILEAVEKDKQKDKRTTFAVTFQQLTTRQQQFLRALVLTKWDVKHALYIMQKTGTVIAKTVPARWLRQDHNYADVYHAMKAEAAAMAVDKGKLILDAEKIRQEALRPKPILFKGAPTGYYENKPDTALRATELLMKTQKMLGNDQEQQTQGNGPPLIIQIVQGEKVVDVTNGVTIDLPSPDNAS